MGCKNIEGFEHESNAFFCFDSEKFIWDALVYSTAVEYLKVTRLIRVSSATDSEGWVQLKKKRHPTSPNTSINFLIENNDSSLSLNNGSLWSYLG